MSDLLHHAPTGATVELPDGWHVLRAPFPPGWGLRAGEAIAYRGPSLEHARRVLWVAREDTGGLDVLVHADRAMRGCYPWGNPDPYIANLAGRHAIAYEWGEGPLYVLTWFLDVDGPAGRAVCRIDLGSVPAESDPHAEARALLKTLRFAPAAGA